MAKRAKRPRLLDPYINPEDHLRDTAALRATTVAIGARTEYFAVLVQRLDDVRQRQRPGQPPVWVQHLREWSSADLAGAILYNLIRASVWTEEEHRQHETPLFSTIATSLGADLLGYDVERNLPLTVGGGLLDVARKADIVEVSRDEITGGIYVRIKPELFNFVQAIVKGARRVILKYRPTRPPTKVQTPRPAEMLLDREEVPLSIMEAMDKLQGTAWRINRHVLKVIKTVDEGLRAAFHKPRVERQRQIILNEADQLSTLDHFYMPIHLDSRGRAYQGRGILTYVGGNDTARGLLEFARGERLDDAGLGWLAWHAGQMWGKEVSRDLPFGNGTAWLSDNYSDLMRCWWDADEPVQFLGAILAFRDACAGKPVHLPVRVDASCSGLQHLALLARDTDLAKIVNLWGIYGDIDRYIAVLVEPKQEDDFYERVATETGSSRKEAKNVIVPLLYGAGGETLGEKLAQLRRGDDAKATPIDKQDAARIIAAAEARAPRAFEVLRWFTKVAEAHNGPKVRRVYWHRQRQKWKTRYVPTEPIPIRWTTPSGFKAIQDYRHMDKGRVAIPFDGRIAKLVVQRPNQKINTRQQSISFPANIVHSLDASLLTEVVAAADIDSWAVAHDAFAVPATRMWDLLRANEKAMRYMYTADRLGEWAEAWRAAGAITVPDPPTHSATLPPEMLKGLRTLG
jgi:hypothetical protein